jgi:hypothetical protein
MAQVLTEKMKALLKKNASFGLTNYPVSIWNYVNLKQYGEHFTEKEMDSLLDAGSPTRIALRSGSGSRRDRSLSAGSSSRSDSAVGRADMLASTV